MRTCWLVVTAVLVAAVGEAAADRVRLSKLGWDLAIAGKDPWQASTRKLGDADADALTLKTKDEYVEVLLWTDTGTCEAVLEYVARITVQGGSSVAAEDRSAWLPKTWYPAAIAVFDPLGTVRMMCRDVASGGTLVVKATTTSSMFAVDPTGKRLPPVLAAFEAATKANNVGALAVAITGKDAAAKLNASIDAAKKAPVPITLAELGVTFDAPPGWKHNRGVVESTERRAFAGPDQIWPRLVATDDNCASGMGAQFEHERVVPSPPGVPSGFSSIVVVDSHIQKMDSYRLCADVDGGVLLINVTLRGRDPRSITPAMTEILASLLRITRDPARPRIEPQAQTLPALGITFTLPRTASVWTIVDMGSTDHSYLARRWPTWADDRLSLDSDQLPCDGTSTFDLLPSTWKGMTKRDYVHRETNAPMNSTYIACAVDGTGRRIVANITAPPTPTAKRAAEIRSALETIGVAFGVPPSASTVPVAPAVVDPTTPSSPAPTNPPSPYAYRSDDYEKPRARSFRSLLHGVTLSVHQLDPRMDASDGSYGASVGYERRLRSVRGQLQVGYDETSKLFFDGRAEIGRFMGEYDFGIGVHAGVGADGVGLGQEPASDRMYLATAAYLGGRIKLDLGSMGFGFGYYVRDSDVASRRTDLEADFRLTAGTRLELGYTGYNGSGRFLRVGLRL